MASQARTTSPSIDTTGPDRSLLDSTDSFAKWICYKGNVGGSETISSTTRIRVYAQTLPETHAVQLGDHSVLFHVQFSLDSDKLGIPSEDPYIEVTAGILTTTNTEGYKFTAIPGTIYPYLTGTEGATRGQLCYDRPMERGQSDDEMYSSVREKWEKTLTKCAEELQDERSFHHQRVKEAIKNWHASLSLWKGGHRRGRHDQRRQLTSIPLHTRTSSGTETKTRMSKKLSKSDGFVWVALRKRHHEVQTMIEQGLYHLCIVNVSGLMSFMPLLS